MNITMYTKYNCPNCVAAKQLLKANGLKYSEVDVIAYPEKFRQMQAYHPDAKQMPQIFIDHQRVGGLAGLRVALNQLELL